MDIALREGEMILERQASEPTRSNGDETKAEVLEAMRRTSDPPTNDIAILDVSLSTGCLYSTEFAIVNLVKVGQISKRKA